jgi:hypothetical protein
MSLFDTGIRPAIDEHIKKLSEERRSYGDYWSASSAGYCMRLVIMRRLGVPKTPEMADKQAITQRIFSSGHIFHSWIQSITKEAGLSIASEVELQDEDLMIRGHFDDLVLIKTAKTLDPSTVKPFKLNGEELKPVLAEELSSHLILYDYKTAHSKWFEYAKGRPMSYYNKMQLGTYMYMLRKDGAALVPTHDKEKDWRKSKSRLDIVELTEARILKISKDDLRLHEMQLFWSDELEKEVLEYWTTLNRYWEYNQTDGSLPRCTCLEQENGFMGKRTKAGKAYNDYFYEDKPCSQAWYEKWKEENAAV